MAEKILQRFGAGGIFLDVDAGFFAQDEAEQRLEDTAAALLFAGLRAPRIDECATEKAVLESWREYGSGDSGGDSAVVAGGDRANSRVD